MTDNHTSRLGLLYAIGAFGTWGILPLFWKQLESIDALTLLAQRIVWSVVFSGILLTITNNWKWIKGTLRSHATLFRYTTAAWLLGLNWGLYIWCINSGYVIEASLGYYMSPLFTVIFGAIFLGEKLRQMQWLSVAVAGLGVLYLAFNYGDLPIFGTILGVTFAAYSVVKKNGKLNAIEASSFESAALLPMALAYLIYLHLNGKGAFGQISIGTDILLILTGLVTLIPLILFAASMTKLSVSTVGIISYTSPTATFLLGVLYYKEPFAANDLIGYAIIWIALAMFSIEGVYTTQRQRSLSEPPI